ncbi:hypothetical protein QYE77_15230 (plasmid) [Thermanaerothrix sp. 4228-RoL]|jgi:hypothetical protein|uniref:Uncharacterized protein n=1 Tax=Thermanaerothrix solaris TaxID=3058434 RepID=A0ABU3NS18_9CHLR|nr:MULTISPECIES: hypothetical protein [unclassified Thermanaerothrix]MDT8899617.1 hypothetical protein [Thermanaerothrix sp. 4228-RoL]
MTRTATLSTTFFFLLFLSAALALAFSLPYIGDVANAVKAVSLSDHAVQKHGGDAFDALDCARKAVNASMLVGLRRSDGRIAIACQAEKKFFVLIFGSDKGNVTAFPKETAKTLQEVIDYLRRTGYKNPVSWGEIQKLIH